MSASEFYYACRNGEFDTVKELLTSMPTAEIDQMEANGSTALHAAAYYGHIDIVRLLLEKGASPNQKNKYDKTPEEEAKTPEIAQLFRNIKGNIGIDWTINDVFSATSHHRRFYSFSQGPPTLAYVVDKVLDAMKSEKEHFRGYQRVVDLFKEALRTNDATLLIRAYTVQSDFYLMLNRTLASHNELTNEERENPPWFCAYARFLASDEPTLRAFRWTGTTYRAVALSEHDLARYQVGAILMNKSFVSTTRSYEEAENFLARLGATDKSSALCEYVIKDDRAAFYISKLSEDLVDDEVLILPCMDFEVRSINEVRGLWKIKLLLR